MVQKFYVRAETGELYGSFDGIEPAESLDLKQVDGLPPDTGMVWSFKKCRWQYDLAALKEHRRALIGQKYLEARAALYAKYTAAAAGTFETQRKEAANPDGPTPFIDALAAANGKVTRAMMIDKINSKAEEFDKADGALLGQKRRMTDAVNACRSVEKLRKMDLKW